MHNLISPQPPPARAANEAHLPPEITQDRLLQAVAPRCDLRDVRRLDQTGLISDCVWRSRVQLELAALEQSP